MFEEGTFKIAAHNWCEDEIQYTVKGNVLTFRENGDDFTLLADEETGDGYILKIVRVMYGDSDQECFSINKLIWTDDMAKYNDDSWTAISMDIERSDKDPVVAAVRMLAMTY